MIRTRFLLPDGHVQCHEGPKAPKQAPEGATTWVDVLATSAAGLDLLAEYRFHPLALEDSINPQRRCKYERFPTHDFLVVLALDHGTEEELDTAAVRVFLRPGLVVTVHDRPLSAINTMDRLFLEDADRLGSGAARVVHALLDSVVDEFMPLLDRWEEDLDRLETDSPDPNAHQVDQLVKTRRDLIVVRRLMLPQLEVVKRLMDNPDTDETSRIYYRDVLDHIDAVYDTTGLLLEVCAGTLQLHNNRSNERLNAVMKYLAIVSTLMLPMTVISGIFGMNFDVIPGAHDQAGFWSAVGLMLLSALGLMAWFRYRRWV